MHMRVDKRRHDSLSGEIHAASPLWQSHFVLTPDLANLIPFDDEGGIRDDPTIAGDQPPAFE
jgi:hypothetical protein